MLRNKICLLLCIVMIAGVLFGCQASQKEKPEDFFADVQIGMTRDEGIEILGMPVDSAGGGPYGDIYVISDDYIAMVWYAEEIDRSDFRCSRKEILTYDEFVERYGERFLEVVLEDHERMKND